MSQPLAPASDGSWPSTGSPGIAPWSAVIIIAPPGIVSRAGNASSSPCSRRAVLTVDSRVSTPVSQPMAMATTASRAAMPSPRRIHSPAPRCRVSAANTRPPIHTASASDVAAPSA